MSNNVPTIVVAAARNAFYVQKNKYIESLKDIEEIKQELAEAELESKKLLPDLKAVAEFLDLHTVDGDYQAVVAKIERGES